MASYTGNFETGTAGSNVLPADPGSATAWDDTFFGADGTLTYSSTEKYQTLSCQSIFSATPQVAYVAWTSATLGSSLTSLWGRIYMHHSAAPSVASVPVRGLDTGARAWQIAIDSSGLVHVQDEGGSDRGVGAVAIATGQWIRIEFHAVNSTTTGFIEAILFNNADSVSPSETITSSGSFSTLSKTDLIRFGEALGLNASRTVYIDNILLNDTGYPGPVAAAVPPQVLSMQSHVFGHNMW